jgi:hypothetical protein
MRRLATIGIVGALGLSLAVPGLASAHKTWIISYWHGGNVGPSVQAVHHPEKIGLVMSHTHHQGYWLIRDVHWRHWGHRRTTAQGKMASAALSGTPVRIRAHGRHTYHACRRPGDTVRFYTRAKIHIKGEDRWRKIPHNSLVPQCNNP